MIIKGTTQKKPDFFTRIKNVASRLGIPIKAETIANNDGYGGGLHRILDDLEAAATTSTPATSPLLKIENARLTTEINTLTATVKSRDLEIADLRNQLAGVNDLVSTSSAKAVAAALCGLAIPPIRDNTPTSDGTSSNSEPKGMDRLTASAEKQIEKIRAARGY